MDYKLILSKRKTVSLSIKEGILTVRAPLGIDEKRIEDLLSKHAEWIRIHLKKSVQKEEKFKNLSDEKIKFYKKMAKVYFEDKTRKFAKIMGLDYGRITITSAKTRFGSCSQHKNICFSYRLMLYPEAAREYVVVHELCHLVHMNHSKDFYSMLEKYMPDYKSRRQLLK